jgi:hypothetical protein
VASSVDRILSATDASGVLGALQLATKAEIPDGYCHDATSDSFTRAIWMRGPRRTLQDKRETTISEAMREALEDGWRDDAPV